MSRRTRLPVLAVVGLLVACLVAGCGHRATPEPTYRPVPDQKLYARIAQLPGVSSVQIDFSTSPDNPSTYVGEIKLRSGSDLARRLDQAIAILRQGRYRALISVSAYSPTQPAVYAHSLAGSTRADFDKRYGPQPGDGRPPDTTPGPH